MTMVKSVSDQAISYALREATSTGAVATRNKAHCSTKNRLASLIWSRQSSVPSLKSVRIQVPPPCRVFVRDRAFPERSEAITKLLAGRDLWQNQCAAARAIHK